MFLLTLCIPIGYVKVSWGAAAIVVALLVATCRAVQNINEEDKLDIRYNIVDVADIVKEMAQWETALKSEQVPINIKSSTAPSRGAVEAALTALAKKHAKQQTNAGRYQDVSLPLHCQEAAYISLRLFPNEATTVASSLSLLALVAKDPRIRQNHVVNPDSTLRLIVQAMRHALKESKKSGSMNETSEQVAAELQRKGCLLLGALSDGHAALAGQIYKCSGLDSIMDALKWFRCHAEVVNWGLWAMFQLSYEFDVCKCDMVRQDAVPLIVDVMRDCPESVHVARHGVALLFDLLRESDEASDVQIDVSQVRKQALDAGVHQVIVHSMEQVRCHPQ